jgi:hypothetical protein
MDVFRRKRRDMFPRRRTMFSRRRRMCFLEEGEMYSQE